jgi:hypothetical protein
MFEISVFRVEVIKWPPLVFPVTLATDETGKQAAGRLAAAGDKIRQLFEKQKRLRAGGGGEGENEGGEGEEDEVKEKVVEVKVENVFGDKEVVEVKVRNPLGPSNVAFGAFCRHYLAKPSGGDTEVVEVVDQVKDEEGEEEVAATQRWWRKQVKEEAKTPPAKTPPPLRRVGAGKAKAIPAKARPKAPLGKAKPRMVLKSKAAPLAKAKFRMQPPTARGSVARMQPPVAGLGLKIVFSIVYILNESLMFSLSRVFNV